MQPTRFGTVRPKQAEILTAKLTAILSDIGAHQRPSADPSCCVFILRGHRWTLADARTAVFKTVGSAKASRASSVCVGRWLWSGDRRSAEAPPIRGQWRVALDVVIRP